VPNTSMTMIRTINQCQMLKLPMIHLLNVKAARATSESSLALRERIGDEYNVQASDWNTVRRRQIHSR